MDALPTVISTSALAPAQKSQIRRIYESVKEGGSTLMKAKLHTAAGATALRQGGESLVVGALLGAADAELPTGLTIHVKGHAVPLDGLLGIGAMIASVGWAQEGEISTTLRNAGSTAIGVSGYRNVHGFLAERKRAKGQTPGSDAAKAAGAHGDFGHGWFGAEGGNADEEDPILKAARSL